MHAPGGQVVQALQRLFLVVAIQRNCMFQVGFAALVGSLQPERAATSCKAAAWRAALASVL